jgi:hypothetical protein
MLQATLFIIEEQIHEVFLINLSFIRDCIGRTKIEIYKRNQAAIGI